VIFDNSGWLASAKAVKDLFPDGEAAKKSLFLGAMLNIRLPLGENVKSLGATTHLWRIRIVRGRSWRKAISI